MMSLVPHDKKWAHLFQEEEKSLRSIFGNSMRDIQHIGSTAIPGIRSKPIIDIAVLLPSLKKAKDFLQPLRQLEYWYDQPSSSSERYFFRKGDPVQFHLSLTAPNVLYWNRQILFRDYLLQHPDAAREYEQLKVNLLQKDPTGGQLYIDGKSAFVEKVLTMATPHGK